MPDGTWSCAECETNNEPQAAACRRCGGTSRRERLQHQSGGSAPAVTPPAPTATAWGPPPAAESWYPAPEPGPAEPFPILGTPTATSTGWGAPRASRRSGAGAIGLVLGLVLLVVVVVAGLHLIPVHTTTPVAKPGSSAGAGDSTGSTSGGSDETPVTSPPEVTSGEVPSGFRSVIGQGGLTLAIPADWPGPQAGMVPGTDQVGPDGGFESFIRYGVLTKPKTDLLTYLETGERTNPKIATDFHRIHLDPISYAGADEGYDWEFTFSKNGQPRHVRACYWTYGGRLYLVYGSAPAADWTTFEPFAETAIHSAQL